MADTYTLQQFADAYAAEWGADSLGENAWRAIYHRLQPRFIVSRYGNDWFITERDGTRRAMAFSAPMAASIAALLNDAVAHGTLGW